MGASEPSTAVAPPLLPAEAWWTNSFMVTFAFRCNIACTFCMVEDALGRFAGTSLEAFRRFAAEPNAIGGASRIIFSGGEVTLAKDLLDYVAVARSLPGVEHVRLQTNAIRLGDRGYLRALVEAGVDEYFVSFHAPDAATYDAIAQQRGAFRGIVRGLEAIRDSGAALYTNTAIVEQNYRLLPAIVEMAASFGPRSIELWSYWPRGDGDGDGSRMLAARVADVQAPLLEALSIAVSRGIPPVVKWFPRCLLGSMAWCQDDGQPPALIEDGYWEQEPEYGCLYESVCAESMGRPPQRSGGRGKCAGLSDAYVYRFGWEEGLLQPVRHQQAAPTARRHPKVARSLMEDAGPRRVEQAQAAAWLAAGKRDSLSEAPGAMEPPTRDTQLTMGAQPPNPRSHEQHRVLAIRGKSFCNSACVFCVEKFTTYHPVAPRADETRQLILQGSGKYNMLFFMNGEPSLHPKLFEYVALAKAEGYRYFGMSSHFRAFADPYFALKILEAGFEFFDISLHAASPAAQAEVNPIDDQGRSLKEALHGLRNLYEIARRTRRRVAVTHKMVISRLNYRDLGEIFRATYRLGVRNFILQPVKASGLDPELTARLAINEDEFMPFVNALLRETEGLGAEVKLYGMSQIGVYESESLVQETNLIKHAFSKNARLTPELHNGDRLVPAALSPSSAVAHRVTVHLPAIHEGAGSAESGTFECKEDQLILNAALAGGVSLPFGCRMGSCGMCVGRLVEGTVERADQLILTDAQIAAGYVLLCKSRPRSDLVIVTHQESELGL